MHGFASPSGKESPWVTNLGPQCCIYLSVPGVLTEGIFQIYVPRDHEVLDHESETTNEFPLTVRLSFLQRP